ncbi:MAG: tyrosine-type recombinase/integrase [bacterium]
MTTNNMTTATHNALKIRQETVIVKGHDYKRWVVDLGVTQAGKRERKTFASEAKAQKFIRQHRKDQARWAGRQVVLERKIGEDADRLSNDHLRDAIVALEILHGGATLTEAAKFFAEHTVLPGNKRTVAELATDFVQTKIAAGRRPDSIRDMRARLGMLTRDFQDTPVNEITALDLERWLDARSAKGVHRLNFRQVFQNFFNFGIKRGVCRINPATAIEKPSIDEKIPSILTTAAAEKLMLTAHNKSPEMVPYFAIAIFAGIRPTELRKLDWSCVDLNARRIRVVPETAKKRRMRYVDISENLVAWLSPHKQEEGLISSSRKYFDYVKKEAGIDWEPDILRHSFGSYHLARHDNAALTSLQMGHMRTDVLFNHYRDLVTRQDADKFWGILPPKQQ